MTQLKVEFVYDDRGFRLGKVNHEAERTTWFVRDASGNVRSIYEQDGVVEVDAQGMPIAKTEPLEQTEVPMYGAGKVGTNYPALYPIDENNPEMPFAYLNYIIYDENLTPVDADWLRVSDDTGYSEQDLSLMGGHQHLKFGAPITINENGYIYIWVSNQSAQTRSGLMI